MSLNIFQLLKIIKSQLQSCLKLSNKQKYLENEKFLAKDQHEFIQFLQRQEEVKDTRKKSKTFQTSNDINRLCPFQESKKLIRIYQLYQKKTVSIDPHLTQSLLKRTKNRLDTLKLEFISPNLIINITQYQLMNNSQFDFTNLEQLGNINWNKFKQFCCLNSKQRNMQFINLENHQKIINIAIQIKNNNKPNTSTFFNHVNQTESFYNWRFSEYKLFTYVIYLYSYMRQVNLKNLNLRDFQHIQKFFPTKPLHYLVYQKYNLFPFKKEKWSQQEDKLLQKIIKQYSNQESYKIQWKRVGFILFSSTRMKIYKSFKQCRERWTNHLDPNLNRKKWTLAQDLLLFKLIQEFGRKWSKLVKKLKSNRTEHMIKNRYNSYLRMWKKAQPNKQQDEYFKEILNYLNCISEEQCIINRVCRYTTDQQKNEQNSLQYQHKKISAINQHSLSKKQEQSQSQSAFSFGKLLSINQILQPNGEIIAEEISDYCKNQSLPGCGGKAQTNVKIRQQILMKQIIPEYMNQLDIQKRPQLYNDIKFYQEMDDSFKIIVDDTFLSQLQQRQNLKWLESYSE